MDSELWARLANRATSLRMRAEAQAAGRLLHASMYVTGELAAIDAAHCANLALDLEEAAARGKRAEAALDNVNSIAFDRLFKALTPFAQ